MNVAILASGEGTNAQALWKSGKELGFEVSLILTDNPVAPVIEKAKRDELNIEIVPRVKNYRNHFNQFEAIILQKMKEYRIDWLFLAGFMSVLSKEFLHHFRSSDNKYYKVLNIHPSLLPLYPGIHSYKEAYNDRVKKHGATVHFVDEGVDTGRIIDSIEYDVDPSWSYEEFVNYGKKIEHKLYTKIFKDFVVNGKVI